VQEPARVGENLAESQPEGLIGDAFAGKREERSRLAFGFGQLFGGDGFTTEEFQFSAEGVFDFRRRVVGENRGADAVQAGVHGGNQAGVDLRGEVAGHDGAIEPAGVVGEAAASNQRAGAARQDRAQNRERVQIGMGGLRRVKSQGQVIRAGVPFDDYPAFPALRRFLRGDVRQRFPRRDLVEGPLDHAQHFSRIEVPGGGEDGVVGGVVGAVMRVEVVAGQRLQITQVPDRVVAVGVNPKGGSRQLLVQQKGGIVFVALALADDDRPLSGDLVGVEEGVGHAVGFDVEGEVGLGRRQRLKVSGEVVPGHAVEIAAFPRDGLIELLPGPTGGSLEQHVFHPVGDAGDPQVFVAAADAIPDPDTGHRRAVRFAQHDRQTVFQRGFEQIHGCLPEARERRMAGLRQKGFLAGAFAHAFPVVTASDAPVDEPQGRHRLRVVDIASINEHRRA